MRRTPSLLAVMLAACGPGVTEDDPQTCGSEGPVRILEDVAVGFAAYAGDRLLVHTDASFPFDPETVSLSAVGRCGENPVSMGDVDLTQYRHGVAGPHALRAEENGTLAWLDTFGQAATRTVFSEVTTCVLPVGDGLVAQTADGTVRFHPNPTRADASPSVLVARAIAPEFPSIPLVDFADCRQFDTERPVLDGEGILVAEEDGPLVRIALPSAEREVLLDGPVGEFALLDDPRYILWRGPSASQPDVDCCAIHVLDRRSGSSEQVDGGVIVGSVGWYGEWLSTSSALGLPEQHQTFRNYVTGRSIRIDGWWDLQAPLSPTELLLRRVGETDTMILDVTTGTLHPVDFPALDWPERAYDDGVVALRRDDPEGTRGDLLRLRFGTRAPDLLAKNVPSDWVRTHGGNLLFIDRDRLDQQGPLVLLEPNGRRRVLAPLASSFSVPHHGTDHERNEVVYFVAEGTDQGMWRFALP